MTQNNDPRHGRPNALPATAPHGVTPPAAATRASLSTRAASAGLSKGRFAWPIAIMSFGRPQLLAGVLRDLRSQTLDVADEQVYLFQDGNVEADTGKVLVDESIKRECIALFRESFPSGNVVAAEANLGIALNFDRAERATLGPGGAEAAAFFEDDMALSEFYLEALGKLLDFALNEDKVGYVAAYGDHHASLEQQAAQRGRIVPMHHKWGFGLTRRQWQRQLPIIEPYLRLIEGRNYVLRDHARIRAYFAELGYEVNGSSQDAAKDIAGFVLGTVKLMCYVCYGKYLGEVGVHSREEDYRRAGYANTVLFPFAVESFDLPGTRELGELAARQRQASRMAQHPPPVPPAAQSAPRPRVPVGFEAPHLFDGELELLQRTMNNGHRRYHEFGLGGSTLLAIRSHLERVVAIDSDPSWIAAARDVPEVAAALASGRATIRHADIGPVSEWGNPRNRDQIGKWPNYIRVAWEAWAEHGELPDLVFVDGRFRVACCLSVILAAGADPALSEQMRVVLHDTGAERPHYDELLSYFDVVASVNTLRVMKIKHAVSASRVMSVFLHRQFDQR